MKHRDYFHLANQMVKSNKKQTRNTLIGLSFGSILLVIVLFMAVSFYAGMISYINGEPTFLSITLNYNNQIDGYFNTRYMDEIADDKNIKNCITYNVQTASYYRKAKNEGFDFNNEYDVHFPKISIDSTKYVYDRIPKYDLGSISDFVFYDMDNSDDLVSKEEEKFFSDYELGKPVLAGSLFTDEIDEVMISSIALDYLELNYEDVIGKKISYSLELQKSRSSSVEMEDNWGLSASQYDGKECFIFKEYKIVGVFNSYIYDSPTRAGYPGNGSDALFWFKQESLYDTDKVKVIQKENGGSFGIVYKEDPSILMDQAYNNKQIFLPYGFNFMKPNNFNEEYSQIIQYKDFKSTYKNISLIEGYLRKSTEGESSGYVAYEFNGKLREYVKLYPYIEIIVAMLSIFAGVLLFATIINMFITMNYSIKKNTKFLSMCKAIGMTNTDVSKLYFTQMFIIMIKSLIWNLGITLTSCLLFTILMNKKLVHKATEAVYPPDIIPPYQFNFAYYPLVFFVTIFVTMIISCILTYLCCYNFKKKNMMSTLNG